jgi:hypothetical protein
VDADVAHRLCAMRFAGRLPTRAELALTRRALGLEAVAVEAVTEPSGSLLSFRPVPEWGAPPSAAIRCVVPEALLDVRPDR